MKVVPQGNVAALRNVGSGGKGSTLDRSLTVQLEAQEASPGSCPDGATSDPTTVDLFIEDDDGDEVFDRRKNSFVCTAGKRVHAKFVVQYRGPENCENSAVPSEQASRGEIFVTATTADGPPLNDTLGILCKR